MNINAVLRFLALLGAGLCSRAAQAQTETYLVARMGMEAASPYHLVELLQTRGPWIFPDVAYLDFSRNNYHELLVGAGFTTYQAKRWTLINGGYLDTAFGSAAKGAKYFLAYTYVVYHVSERVGGEVYYVPYLPLNSAGRIHHILERAKLEYDFGRFKLGAGYAGNKIGSDAWQNTPFITATLKGGRLGDLEFWFQRLPENKAQFQLRYVASHKSREK